MASVAAVAAKEGTQMSVPYLNLEEGDGIAVIFKNQIFIPMPIPVPGLPVPVMVMKVGTVEGTFVEWIRDSVGDPVGVVLVNLDGDTYCLPLATPDDRGGVYVVKLHEGAIEEMKAQRAQAQAAQDKASGRSPAIVLAHPMPGRPPGA